MVVVSQEGLDEDRTEQDIGAEIIYERAERNKVPEAIVRAILYNLIIFSPILMFAIIDLDTSIEIILVLSTIWYIQLFSTIIFLILIGINYFAVKDIIELKDMIISYSYNEESKRLTRIITIKNKRETATYNLTEFDFITVIKIEPFDSSSYFRLEFIKDKDTSKIIVLNGKRSNLIEEAKVVSEASGISTYFPDEVLDKCKICQSILQDSETEVCNECLLVDFPPPSKKLLILYSVVLLIIIIGPIRTFTNILEISDITILRYILTIVMIIVFPILFIVANLQLKNYIIERFKYNTHKNAQ